MNVQIPWQNKVSVTKTMQLLKTFPYLEPTGTQIRARTKRITQQKWREVPPSHFTRVWRDINTKAICKLNRGNLRKITMFLTGYSTLNYHLNKYKPDKINKTCPQSSLSRRRGNYSPLHWAMCKVVSSMWRTVSLVLLEYNRGCGILLDLYYPPIH